MSVFFIEPDSLDQVPNPLVVQAEQGAELERIIRFRNESGSAAGSLVLVPGDGFTAEWTAASPPLSVPNNNQQPIRLTFDTSEPTPPGEPLQTSFSVESNRGTAQVDIEVEITAPPASGKRTYSKGSGGGNRARSRARGRR